MPPTPESPIAPRPVVAPRHTKPVFYFGLDLGELRDFTALTILEQRGRHPATSYDCLHTERFALDTSYVRIAELVRGAVVRMVVRARMAGGLAPEITVAMDFTGVGIAIRDVFADLAPAVALVPIQIHGGHSVVRDGSVYRVPKKELIGALVVLFQAGRLRLARDNPHTAQLVTELTTFKRRFTKLGNETFGPEAEWRQGAHDDLVLSMALAAWLGEERAKRSAGGYGYSYLDPAADLAVADDDAGTDPFGNDLPSPRNAWGRLRRTR